MRCISPSRTALFAIILCCVLTACAKTTPAQTMHPSYASDKQFANWLSAFRSDAEKEGISRSLLDNAFRNVTLLSRVVELDRKQPEGTMTFAQYKDRIVSADRIARGREMLAENRAKIEKAAQKYGVQPRFIVALWGIETNYGQNTGGFSVIDSLTTLAYDGRRPEFFRKELINALKIVQGGHIALADMDGSWAGALGQCQFMPSSFHNFAVDGNGDGKKDIWNNLDDVFASIANYLSKSGWDASQTWGRAVSVPAGFNHALADNKIERSVAEWQKLGVRAKDGSELAPNTPRASLVFPDEGGDEAYFAYNNYKTVMKWNRSLYFATSVGLLSDAIEQK